ncbi:alpha/beta fold hydrolase [Paenibacillus protaetiae]|uniref:Alpha/beta fold hydrolase n=2 Tax=Paenibacillus protaetiae TaxID=2509456 RepID=A0A4P6F163_9BACL|nr:alpha/beta fold hydrolase [Paenibacillus protaetiae]
MPQRPRIRTVEPLTFVLVHGSWADVTFWDGVAAGLRKLGHHVYVPEYPGHGAMTDKKVTHAQISRAIADDMIHNNVHQAVLVGHSFGGSVIQKTAELVPDRIKRLVFLDAFVLKDGESVSDEFPPDVRSMFEALRKSSADDTIMLPYPVFRETFVNLAGQDLVNRLYSRISPEPAAPLFEKLDLKTYYSLTIPKSYIYLIEDNVFPQGSNEFGWHPHMSSRLGLFRLLKGFGDHMTTAATEPMKLAYLIYSAGRD